MRVRDAMTSEVRTIDESATLDVADELMREEVIRHLPVVSGRRLVGVVTQRDLFRAGLSSALRSDPALEHDWFVQVPVRSIMTRHVLHAHPDASLADAADLMVRERIGCLPVVEDDELVGLLTETDCLRALLQLLRSHERR
ncbi:MAG: CBS domain-containing protein [Thermodesulfobacteriota bacterium]